MQVEDIRKSIIQKYKDGCFVVDKSGCKTVELEAVSFNANETSIFGKVDGDYIQRELEWYKSQSLNVDDIPGKTPAIWKQVSDASGRINSNYGYLIYSGANHAQYQNTISTLENDPYSRRAVMIYTRPSMHYEFCTNGMSDFICTNTVQYLIRDNKVNAIVQMRSNDVVFGYRNDYAWQKHVLNKLTNDLKKSNPLLEEGNISWQVGSLHVYERHFGLIEKEIEMMDRLKSVRRLAAETMGDAIAMWREAASARSQ
jgi:thymidylate synthase